MAYSMGGPYDPARRSAPLALAPPGAQSMRGLAFGAGGQSNSAELSHQSGLVLSERFRPESETGAARCAAPRGSSLTSTRR